MSKAPQNYKTLKISVWKGAISLHISPMFRGTASFSCLKGSLINLAEHCQKMCSATQVKDVQKCRIQAVR